MALLSVALTYDLVLRDNPAEVGVIRSAVSKLDGFTNDEEEYALATTVTERQWPDPLRSGRLM